MPTLQYALLVATAIALILIPRGIVRLVAVTKRRTVPVRRGR